MAPSENSPMQVLRGIVGRQATGDAGPSGSASPSPGDGNGSSPSPSSPSSSSTSTSTSSSTSTTTSHTTSSSPPPTSSSPPPTSSSTSTTSTTTSSSTTTTSSSAPPPTSSSTTQPPSSTEPPSSSSSTHASSSTTTIVVTSTTTGSPTAPTSSASHSPTPISAGADSGLKSSAKVAIGVVVPIAAIAILAVIALFWWRKRKARLESEEERRKEVEDYSYNPNADPTIPAVGLITGDAAGYEMREDASAGYRGWGSTTAAGSGSVGRKGSTTLSNAGALSEGTAPRAGGYDGHDGGSSPEGEILGAMGPAAANNRGDVHRGPSNASSSYSATGRSEGSDGGGMYPGGAAYYDQYGNGAYGDGGAVIRDNPARRNTQIENTSHYPQQSAGIAQNF